MQVFTPHDFAAGLLDAHGFDSLQLEQLLHRKHPQQASFSELYLQRSQSRSYGYEESQLKTIDNATTTGCGARVVCGELTGFAYCDSFATADIAQALETAAAIAKYGNAGNKPTKVTSSAVPVYEATPTNLLETQQLTDLFAELDAKARAMPQVERVELSLAARDEQILVLNTLGTCQADLRPLWRAQVRLVLHKQDKRESGNAGYGGRSAYNLKSLREGFAQLLDLAYTEASTNLDAKPCKAGEQTIVLGPGWPGVLLHEAVGHGLEGDFNRKQTSIYSGRIGTKVAAENCTVVDNGTMPERRGSLTIDDEGNPTRENILIEKGVLCGYMQDMHNAMLMGQQSTGNGRRESYAHTPMPRMTNTYMLPGAYSQQEIIESVSAGIFAVNFNGGQVDITSGNFVFNTSLAYRIEKGKITHAVKGVSLIGNGPDVMRQVAMTGNDLALDSGIGVCGKDGQSVPVGVGQPTLKITSSIVVGGQD